MPFQSKSQERMMWAQHPDIARRWEAETPNRNKLPERKRATNGTKKLLSGK